MCALTAGATLGGRDALFEVLAAILHLGDVAFEGEDKAVLDAAGQKALDAAAAALQYTPGELLLQLTERWIAAGPSEEICITLAPAEARQVLEALVARRPAPLTFILLMRFSFRAEGLKEPYP